MTQGKMGYWVDLADYKFDEKTDSTWIHAMPIGNYHHPVYGDINITPDRVKNFADGIAKGIRGQQLNIDYDHKEGIAAGWVQQAEARDDGLWCNVKWTPNALKALHDGEYRYFSPEFQDEWTHPATRQTHKDVLFGGGITNRPYMKGILPINMSELEAYPAKLNEGSKGMSPEQIKKLALKFKLSEDATEDQVMEAIEKANIAETAPKPDDDSTKALSELTAQIAEVKKLAETNSNLKPMVTLLEAQQVQMSEMVKRLEVSEAATRLSEAANATVQLSEKAKAKGYAVPIPVRDKITKFFSENPKKLNDSFSEIVGDLLDAKLVKLGETKSVRNTSGTGDDGDDDPVKKFTEAANKLAKDEKMTFSEAVNKIANDDPELFEEYRAASYSGRSND